MESAVIRKRLNDFLNSEKSGEGKKVSKPFKDGLNKFFTDLVYDAIKEATDNVSIINSLPEADARLVGTDLAKDIGVESYYVIFKQVRSQVKGSLQLKFGWQFTVLKGKTEEIQIRNDYGVMYKINGDWVLRDLVFKNEADAVARCNAMNEGTESVAIEKAASDDAKVIVCAKCGAFIDLGEAHQCGDGYLCADCAAEDLDEGEEKIDGEKEAVTDVDADVNTGRGKVGVDSEGAVD